MAPPLGMKNLFVVETMYLPYFSWRHPVTYHGFIDNRTKLLRKCDGKWVLQHSQWEGFVIPEHKEKAMKFITEYYWTN